MARNETISISSTAWTELTDANVTALRVQNVGGGEVKLMATVGAVAPSDDSGCITLSSGSVLAADLSLADIWPGVPGANRVWGKGLSLVSVSHG